DGICGSDFLALSEGFVSPAGEELVEVVAQAGDRLWIVVVPAVGEAACRRSGLRPGPGIHDGVEGGLDGGLVGLAHLVEDVADLVRPAALDRHGGIGGGKRRRETGAAIDADHLERVASDAAADEIAEEALPLGGALALGQA